MEGAKLGALAAVLLALAPLAAADVGGTEECTGQGVHVHQDGLAMACASVPETCDPAGLACVGAHCARAAPQEPSLTLAQC